ncbi:MAG: hypothetical protein ACJAX5_002939 [Patiriisocius sp.]|jgi:hypothetical protein
MPSNSKDKPLILGVFRDFHLQSPRHSSALLRLTPQYGAVVARMGGPQW